MQERGIFSKQIETLCLIFYICTGQIFIFKQIFFTYRVNKQVQYYE